VAAQRNTSTDEGPEKLVPVTVVEPPCGTVVGPVTVIVGCGPLPGTMWLKENHQSVGDVCPAAVTAALKVKGWAPPSTLRVSRTKEAVPSAGTGLYGDRCIS